MENKKTANEKTYREAFREAAKKYITPERVKAKIINSQKLKKEFDKGLRPSSQAMSRVYDAIID